MKQTNRMKSLGLTLVAVLALASPAFAVTFGSATLAVGDSWTETSSYGSDITVTIDNGMGAGNPHNGNSLLGPTQRRQQKSISRVKSVKVTSVAASRISGLEVQYSQVTVNGVDQTSMFAGKKYAIDIDGNHVSSVAYVGSTAEVPAAEVAFVTSDNSNVGQVREMRRTFGGETVSIGSSLTAKNPNDLFDVGTGLTVSSFSMKLTSVEGEAPNQIASFDVALTITGGVKKGKGASGDAPFATSSVQMNLAGPLRASVANGRIIDFSLSGPATAGGEKESKGKNKSGQEVVGKKGANGAGSRSMVVTADGTASLAASFVYP
jgi:hypothetical protein